MKRFIFLISLFAIAVFVLPAYADPITKEVEVVNAADNPVPVTMDQATVTVGNDASNPVPVDLGGAALTIGNDQSNPVPVSMVDGCTKTVFSGNYEFTPSIASQVLMTVPENSVFIVTDLIVSWAGGSVFDVGLSDGATTKFSMRVLLSEGQYYSFNFNSGIPFASGSEVIIANPSSWTGRVFISGYTTSCF